MNRVEATSGVKNNPSAGTTLAISPSLVAGLWQLVFVMSADAAVAVDIVHYAADGATALYTQRVYLPANGTQSIPLALVVNTGETLKMSNVAALTGNASASIVGVGGR